MKSFFSLLLLLGTLASTVHAQFCSLPQSSAFVQSNNITARILNGGDLFTNSTLGRGQFFPNYNPNNPNNVSTIYAAGLWMGGVDQNSNLKLSAVAYRSGGKGDYSAGPLDQNGFTDATNCSNWDKVFRVTGSEIAAFRAALPLTEEEGIAQFPSILGWPGFNNPHFSTIYGFDISTTTTSLAPFFDANQNGIYEPLTGDYPVVSLQGQESFIPAEIIWCVFNDQSGGAPHTQTQGKPFNAEIQLTVWAMLSNSFPILNNTVFTSHKIIHRGQEQTDSIFIGLWVDIDLGCYLDDYVGSNPDLNAFFAYNQDMVDGNPGNTCAGIPTFSDIPPVQSVTLLSHSMDKFSYLNGENGFSATADPNSSIEYYNVLSGSWRDGTPVTVGNSGYGGSTPVDHVFPDDPSDPAGWSMCTASLPFADRKGLAIHKIGSLLPGQIEELNAAWSVHYITESPCNIGNTFTDIETITDIYNNGFSNLSKVINTPKLTFDLLPNPASHQVLCRYGDISVDEIRVFDAAGMLIISIQNPDTNQTSIDVSSLDTGIYAVQIIGKNRMGIRKISVIH